MFVSNLLLSIHNLTQLNYKEPTGELKYMKTTIGIRLVWHIIFDIPLPLMPFGINSIYVSATDPGVVYGIEDHSAYLDNFSEGAYKVWELGYSPVTAERELLRGPISNISSPNGWHSQHLFSTIGENSVATPHAVGGREMGVVGPGGAGGVGLVFDTLVPSTNAAVVQVFYFTNAFHDYTEPLGFTRASGNFEGPDAINFHIDFIAGSSITVRPLGQRSLIRVGFTNTRRTSFDGGIMAHELTHGMTMRLTGGAHNVDCLLTPEAMALGEGWGDFMAMAVILNVTHSKEFEFRIGEYITPGTGIRARPYSGMRRVKWSQVDLSERHVAGENWATMLLSVLWNFVESFTMGAEGLEVNYGRDGVPVGGRNYLVKLVIEALKLQPCEPGFIQARDAILDADVALTGGKAKCEIWKGFA